MTLFFTLLSIFLYSFTTLLLWMRGRQGIGDLNFSLIVLWGSAVICHALGLDILSIGSANIDLSFFRAVSLSMLLISLTLFLSCVRRPLGVLGLIVLPITIAAVLLDYMNADSNILINADTPGIQVHIISSFLAYSFLNLAGIQTIAIYMQDKRLKDSSLPGLLAALPSLDVMENLLFNLIGIGMLLLTISFISGWIVHENLFSQHLVHKTVLSAIAWLFFFAVLTGRLLFGWRGKSLWKTVLSGIILLILSYLGSKFVLELILHRV